MTIIADFDPILANHYHKQTWKSYHAFMKVYQQLSDDVKGNIQLFCSRHDATTGTLPRMLAQHAVYDKMKALCENVNSLDENKRYTTLSCMPGVWERLKLHKDKLAFSILPIAKLYPASHHEKLCVIDDKVVFVGGIDIDRGRLDNLDHKDDRAWHDVALKIEDIKIGEFFGHHFRYRWNVELMDFLQWMEKLKCPFDEIIKPVMPKKLSFFDSKYHKALEFKYPEHALLPLRTSTKQEKSSFSIIPKRIVKQEILAAMTNLIAQTNEELFIETQYLRSRHIADAICSRALLCPRMQCSIVLPWLPEDAHETNDPDPITRDGQDLQIELIRQIREVMGDRFRVFSYLRGEGAGPVPTADKEDIYKQIIYVHSKVMISDAKFAIIGSANLNARSMSMDTETAVLWKDAEAVSRFRRQLLDHALGNEAEYAVPSLPNLNKIAQRNKSQIRNAQTGFVVPMPDYIAGAFARENIIIPDELG